MVAPFDFSKIINERNKRLGLRAGFSDPITWISTGNYALNKMISNHFDRGIPLGGVSIFAGEPASGKSYIVSGNIVKDALEKGCQVMVFDSEDALKETWMRNLGVNPEHPMLHKEVVSTIDNIASCINDCTKDYVKYYKDTPRQEQQKLLFVVDSLGFVQTQAEIDQFNKGELKGDMGIKAKMLKMLVANCIRLFSGYEIGLVATNHTYKSQDRFNPDDKITGGDGTIFAASVVVSLNKFKLKQDDEGHKITSVRGIRSKIKCVKTRYAKPYEEVEVTIPYDIGMNPYSGLFDMCTQHKVFTQSGAYYCYTSAEGAEHKLYRKDMSPEFFDMVMREWVDHRVGALVVEEDVPDVE